MDIFAKYCHCTGVGIYIYIRSRGINILCCCNILSNHTLKKINNRNCFGSGPDIFVSRQDFKAAIINIFKELKEILLKKLKEDMVTIS